MKKTLFILFILLSPILGSAQLNCIEQLECKIIAPSGMRMRAEPNLKSKPVTSVPFDSTLTTCKETYGKMTYENIHGFWRKVSYQGKVGFMFDGFLEITSVKENFIFSADTNKTSTNDSIAPPKERKAKPLFYNLLTEAYNYCGDVSKIDPGLLWYGIYPANPQDPNGFHTIKEIEVNVLLSKQKVGKGLEFDIETDQEEKSIFLIGLNQALPLRESNLIDHSERLRYNNRKVYPGQEWILTEGNNTIKLAATGSVESTGPCPNLSNYKLYLKGEKHLEAISQDITAELVETGQCKMPEIYWYGDLTSDGIPEIIFVSVYEEKNQFTLFVSNPLGVGYLVKKEATWTIDKCY